MAIAPSATYPAQTDADPAYPQGKARNASSFQDGTGTPLEKRWLNDLWGFQQALLDAADISPSGVPDQVGASDYLDAIEVLAENAGEAAAKASLDSQVLKGWTRLTGVAPQIAGARDPSTETALISNGLTGGTYRVHGDGSQSAAGNIGNAGIQDMARDPVGNVYVAGVLGTLFAYRSTNFGTNWTVATTKPAAGAIAVVWGDAAFLAIRGDNNTIYTSPTGDVWTLRSTFGGILVRSICATKDAGGVERLLIASQNAVEVSSDSGASWAAAGTLPDAAHHTASKDGVLASVPVGNQVLPFFLACIDGGTAFRVYRATAAGTGWTQLSTLPVPASLGTDNGQVFLRGDPDTGILVAGLRTNGAFKGSFLWLSRDGGLTWSAPVSTHALANGVTVANGRVFTGTADGLSMSCFEAALL